MDGRRESERSIRSGRKRINLTGRATRDEITSLTRLGVRLDLCLHHHVAWVDREEPLPSNDPIPQKRVDFDTSAAFNA